MSALKTSRALFVAGIAAVAAIGALVTSADTAWAQSQAGAPRRVAMVIGNAHYLHAKSLKNPSKDAQAIADRFREAGFDTAGPLLDLNLKAMQDAVRDFGARAEQAEVAVFYYAGHGVEFSGENYLLPVDIAVETENDTEDRAVKLSLVLDAVKKARQLKVVILDACRDNPFAERYALQGAGSVGHGLANIEPSSGVLVAFAARHGTVAFDGEGERSPFTLALLQQLARPGIDVLEFFSEVAKTVRKATNARQEPYTYGSVDIGRDRVALVAWRPEPTKRSRPIFPQSSEREITHDELAALSCGELYLARNEIYARKGLCFVTERARVNFDIKGCTTTRQDIISATEQANVSAIRRAEIEQRCTN
jgi:hypothetical protein